MEMIRCLRTILLRSFKTWLLLWKHIQALNSTCHLQYTVVCHIRWRFAHLAAQRRRSRGVYVFFKALNSCLPFWRAVASELPRVSYVTVAVQDNVKRCCWFMCDGGWFQSLTSSSEFAVHILQLPKGECESRVDMRGHNHDFGSSINEECAAFSRFLLANLTAWNRLWYILCGWIFFFLSHLQHKHMTKPLQCFQSNNSSYFKVEMLNQTYPRYIFTSFFFFIFVWCAAMLLRIGTSVWKCKKVLDKSCWIYIFTVTGYTVWPFDVTSYFGTLHLKVPER